MQTLLLLLASLLTLSAADETPEQPVINLDQFAPICAGMK